MTTAWLLLRDLRPLDVAVPGAVLAVGVTELVARGVPHLPLALAAYVAAVVVLLGRRRWPALSPVGISMVALVSGVLGGAQAFVDAASWLLPPFVASFSTGLYVPRSRAAVGLASVLVALGVWLVALVWLGDFDADPVFGLIMYVVPWVAGLALRITLDRNSELAVETERARQEQALARAAAASAADEERLRIARELHDVLAHSLTAMVVQASVAQDLLTSDPHAAGQALRHVQDRGRAVLDETGRLLRAERGLTHGAQPEALRTMSALVADFRKAGLDVDADLEAVAGAPPHVAFVVGRVLEEGMTNALRHASSRAVDVSVERDGALMRVVVANRAGVTPRQQAPTPGAGLGILGLRERVSGCGGHLEVRADSDQFALIAQIPVEDSTWTR